MLKGWLTLRGLPRTIWIMALAALANRLGTMALPYLVLYLVEHERFSTAQAGWVMAAYGATAFLGAYLSGRLSDRFGPLVVLRSSLVLGFVAMAIYPFVHGFVPIVIATGAWALVAELFRPASMAGIAQFAPAELRQPAFALYRLCINLGMSIGPAAGGFLADYSFPALFWVDGGTNLLAAAVLWCGLPRGLGVPDPPRAASGTNETVAPARAGHPLADPRMLLIVFGTILYAASYMQAERAMGLFLTRDLHQAVHALGLVFTINTLLIVALEVPLNAATAAWKPQYTLALGALLLGLGLGANALATSFLGVALACVVWTFGEMILFPAVSAVIATIAPATRQGSYMSYYTMSWGLAITLGTWAGLQLYEGAGARILWCATFGSCFVAALLFLRLRGVRTAE